MSAETDLPEVIDYVRHFQKRVVQDAFAEAESLYWTNRANRFEQAQPRPGDSLGEATVAEVEDRRLRLVAIVAACRRRAEVSIFGGLE